MLGTQNVIIWCFFLLILNHSRKLSSYLLPKRCVYVTASTPRKESSYFQFFLTSLLEYNCFTMLCYFLLYMHIFTFFSQSAPGGTASSCANLMFSFPFSLILWVLIYILFFYCLFNETLSRRKNKWSLPCLTGSHMYSTIQC